MSVPPDQQTFQYLFKELVNIFVPSNTLALYINSRREAAIILLTLPQFFTMQSFLEEILPLCRRLILPLWQYLIHSYNMLEHKYNTVFCPVKVLFINFNFVASAPTATQLNVLKDHCHVHMEQAIYRSFVLWIKHSIDRGM